MIAEHNPEQQELIDSILTKAIDSESYDHALKEVYLSPMPDYDSFLAKGSVERRIGEYAGAGNKVCFDSALYTIEQETHQFRKYGYLRYCLRDAREGSEESASLLAQAIAVRNEIAAANIRLCYFIARRFKSRPKTLLFSECISSISLSLLEAIDHFDWTRDIKFVTYAAQALVRQMVRVIESHRSHFRRYLCSKMEFADRLLGTDDPEPISELDHFFDNTRRKLKEIVAQEQDDETAQRDLQVLKLRYGLDPAYPEGLTHREIGVIEGVSKPRIAQLEWRAINRVLKALYEQTGDERYMAVVEARGPKPAKIPPVLCLLDSSPDFH